MAIYILTGKLGGGKTLAAVSKIDSALAAGRRVATNLDLRLPALPSLSRRSRKTNVIRLPDRPSAADIRAIGFGIPGVESLSGARKAYDESKFGILVLDECGTWLNSREWQEEGRRDLINFLLHIRKHLWDVYLIIQDISMLDKQARKALAEHVVYCRRMDRISIPVIGTLVGLFTGNRVKLPKFHLAIVKYGDQPQSLTVDKWWFRGSQFYDAYDTTQVFLDDYPHGLFSLLPPFYEFRRSFVDWDFSKYMKLTKIYLRQWSRTLLLASGVLAGAAVAALLSPTAAPVAAVDPVADVSRLQAFAGGDAAGIDATVRDAPLIDRLRFDSLFTSVGGREEVLFRAGESSYDANRLAQSGLVVRRTANCRYKVIDGKSSRIIRCTD